MGCLAQMLAREGVCCYSATACVTTHGCYMRMKGIMALCRFCGPQRAGAARSAAERRPFFNFECCCRLFTSLLKTSPFLIEVILHTSFILFIFIIFCTRAMANIDGNAGHAMAR